MSSKNVWIAYVEEKKELEEKGGMGWVRGRRRSRKRKEGGGIGEKIESGGGRRMEGEEKGWIMEEERGRRKEEGETGRWIEKEKGRKGGRGEDKGKDGGRRRREDGEDF